MVSQGFVFPSRREAGCARDGRLTSPGGGRGADQNRVISGWPTV